MSHHPLCPSLLIVGIGRYRILESSGYIHKIVLHSYIPGVSLVNVGIGSQYINADEERAAALGVGATIADDMTPFRERARRKDDDDVVIMAISSQVTEHWTMSAPRMMAGEAVVIMALSISPEEEDRLRRR